MRAPGRTWTPMPHASAIDFTAPTCRRRIRAAAAGVIHSGGPADGPTQRPADPGDQADLVGLRRLCWSAPRPCNRSKHRRHYRTCHGRRSPHGTSMSSCPLPSTVSLGLVGTINRQKDHPSAPRSTHRPSGARGAFVGVRSQSELVRSWCRARSGRRAARWVSHGSRIPCHAIVGHFAPPSSQPPVSDFGSWYAP
jgi:hypothetical protein